MQRCISYTHRFSQSQKLGKDILTSVQTSTSSRLTSLLSTTTALLTTGNGNNDDNVPDGDKDPVEWWIIVLAVGVSVLFIILVILTICLCRKRKQGKYEVRLHYDTLVESEG